jgi:CRP-like cAMP-binding protein
MADLSSVRNAPILDGVTEEGFAELEAIAHLEAAKIGERLFVRGEAAEKFYIVEAGAFALTLPMRRFDDVLETAIEEKEAGAALGWSSLVAPFRSIYSCYCTAAGSLVGFQRAELARLMSSNRDLGGRISMNLNRLIADRLRALQSLWIEEVEQSNARVERWAQTEIANHLALALHPPRKKPASGHRFFRRGGGPSPSARH